MQNPIFLDIGSHQGQEIKWALEHGYQVYAFEPNPHMRPYLERFENNAMINYSAAWNEDGLRYLYMQSEVEANSSEMGVSLIKEKTNVTGEYIQVDCVNIGKYLQGLDRDIDILKIDAEGAEYVILQSILDYFDPKRIKRWYVEDHENYIQSNAWLKEKEKVLGELEQLDIKLEAWDNKL